MSVQVKKQDYRNKRRGDGKTLVAAMKMQKDSTEEVILNLIQEIEKQYPNRRFLIEHDGIIKFTVKCDDQIIYIGDHYVVEKMLEKGTYIFSNQLVSRIKEMM